jgi:hypothetical protein
MATLISASTTSSLRTCAAAKALAGQELGRAGVQLLEQRQRVGRGDLDGAAAAAGGWPRWPGAPCARRRWATSAVAGRDQRSAAVQAAVVGFRWLNQLRRTSSARPAWRIVPERSVSARIA